MPTVMSHALVPIAFGLALGRHHIPLPLVVMGAVAAMLPDIDVVAFRIGIPYSDAFGHRGASHALSAAVGIALLGAIAAPLMAVKRLTVFLFLFLAAASHGLLDTLTNGGLGVALLWPWSDIRYFAPFTPVEVSPIGRNFLSVRGLRVLLSESLWIGIPCVALALALRRTISRPSAD